MKMLLDSVAMSNCRTWFLRQKWLAGLLCCSVLAMLLFPSHLHLHHFDGIDNSSQNHHAHMIDLHFFNDLATHTNTDSDSTSLNNGPGGLVKKFSDFSLNVVLLVVFLLLLPLTGIKINWGRKNSSLQPTRYYTLFPPLRAPPQS
jgi:hypothetical protein